ncbi:DUF3347 domain-containing protein [Olivibacter domesticus]|uniref:DUF3347 domain-containing protein n=1 Tax=Olivibacter domesticus TaxID=407022 RepID=A0A1H7IUM8_OLID1|nr:DUF3347 domain-containing protein [Olivibacter domesticus]SEK64485.1 Protein of unknown function [Olivibacter domesticus]
MNACKPRNSLLIMMLMVIFAACNGSGQNNKSDGVDTSSTVTAEGIILEDDTLTNVLAAYMQLKDALVASDAKIAGEASDKLAENLKIIHGCENTAILAQELANSNDLTLQRTAFSTISKDLIAMYQHASLNSGEIYVMHCPMYNNKQGGDWLSTSAEIKNPYFGNEMLTCGTVIQEIK